MDAIVYTQNQITGAPVWLHDGAGNENLLPGPIKLDAAAFALVAGVTVTLTAAAAANATALTVTALSGPIPSGTVLYAGAEKYATTTADAIAGATSISVQPLVTAWASGDVARYLGDLTARKLVRAGTPVGRTFAERASKAPFGPAADTDDEVYLLAFDVEDAAKNSAGVAVRPARIIYENFVPGWNSFSAALKAKLRTVYQTQTGIA